MYKKLLAAIILSLMVLAACNKEKKPETQVPVEKKEVPVVMQDDFLPSQVAVQIKGKEFLPPVVDIKATQKLVWMNMNMKPHFIACYQQTQRIFLSEKVLSGQEYKASFEKPGNYYCIETIYGARMNVTVS